MRVKLEVKKQVTLITRDVEYGHNCGMLYVTGFDRTVLVPGMVMVVEDCADSIVNYLEGDIPDMILPSFTVTILDEEGREKDILDSVPYTLELHRDLAIGEFIGDITRGEAEIMI